MATVSIQDLPAQDTVRGGFAAQPFAGVTLSDPDYTAAAGGGETLTITDPDSAALTLEQPFTDGSTSNLSSDGSTLTIENADPRALTGSLQGLSVDPALALQGTETPVPLSFSFSSGNGGGTATATSTITVSGTIPPQVIVPPIGPERFGATFAPFAAAIVTDTFGNPVSVTVTAQDVQGGFDLSALPDPSIGTGTANGGVLLAGTADQVQSALRALLYTAQYTSGDPTGDTTVFFQLDEVVAGVSSRNVQIASLAPPQADPVVLGVQLAAGSLSIGTGQELQPFAATSFGYAGSPRTTLTATFTATGASGNFDLGAANLIPGVSTSIAADGTVTLLATAAIMQQALNAVAFTAAGGDGLGVATFGLAVSDPSGNTASSQQAVQVLPPYVADIADDIWSVTGEPSVIASIDLSTHPGALVFGGNSLLELTGGQDTTVVLNGSGFGAADIETTGSTVIWTGAQTTNVSGSGSAEILLGATAGQSGTLNLDASAGTADQLVVFGSAGTTQTITTTGPAASTVFGGVSALDFQGSNATLVLNGPNASGIADISGGDGNTIWAGQGAVSYAANGGSDTLILTETTTASVFGSTTAATGTTTVLDLGGASSLTVVGGAEAERVDVSASHATVFGGAGTQDLSLTGSGSLEVVDAAGATGAQSISAAAGSLLFFGGTGTAAITLGSGAAAIQAGSGNTTLTGGSGSLSLDLSRAAATVATIDGSRSGAVDITGYDPTRATVTVSDYSSRYVSDGSTVFVLDDGNTVTFHGYVSRA